MLVLIAKLSGPEMEAAGVYEKNNIGYFGFVNATEPATGAGDKAPAAPDEGGTQPATPPDGEHPKDGPKPKGKHHGKKSKRHHVKSKKGHHAKGKKDGKGHHGEKHPGAHEATENLRHKHAGSTTTTVATAEAMPEKKKWWGARTCQQ